MTNIFDEIIDMGKMEKIIQNLPLFRGKWGRFIDFRNKYAVQTEKQAEKVLIDFYKAHKLSTLIEYKRIGKSARRFSKTPSLQGISRVVRHTIAKDIYDDIDVVNCHPTFLLHLCKIHGFNSKWIEYYLTNTKQCREYVMLKKNICKDEAKRIFLSILNKHEDTPLQILDEKCEWLEGFIWNCNDVRIGLSKLDIYKNHLDKVIKSKVSDPFNILGSFINVIFCEMEDKVLQIMIDETHKQGWKIGTLVFDGMMIQKNSNRNNDSYLRSLEESIKRITGFNVSLIIKSMDEGLDVDSIITEGLSTSPASGSCPSPIGPQKGRDDALFELDISNQAFAQRFVEEWKNDLKYSKKLNILYLYNHVSLLHEEIEFSCLTTMFLDLMKKITTEADVDRSVMEACLNKAKNTSYQNSCLSQVKNYIILGAQDQFIEDKFDAIKYFFPFLDKVINLKTGEIRLREREDYFTKTTSNVYNPNWDKEFVNFSLLTLFGNNPNVVNDWKRIMGYSLTGENNLKKIFLMVGKGNNGKSVEIKKLQQILGFLSVKANERLFKISTEAVHNTEIFSLIGKRVAHITELKEGDKFNESLLKAISGDDREFSARRAGSPHTCEIIIQSKLFLATNEVPQFSVGAMANRLIVIPFNQVFEQNPDVEDLIMSHKNDFFSCYCDEAVEFYKSDRKIIFSNDVLQATSNLKKEKDTFLSFIDENYILSPEAQDTDRIKKTDLFQNYYSSFGVNEGIKLSRNKFYERCEDDLKLEKYGTTHYRKIKTI